MAKEFARAFYKSKQWKKCRKEYIASVFGLCEECGEVGYIVHHKIHITESNIDNHEITLSHDNLEYLCLECHNRHHNFDRKKEKIIRDGFNFDSEGNLIQVKSPPKNYQ